MRRLWIPVLLLTLLLAPAPPAQAADTPLAFAQLRALWHAWTSWLLGPGQVAGQTGVYMDPWGGSPTGAGAGQVVGQTGSYMDPWGSGPTGADPARVVGQTGEYMDPNGNRPAGADPTRVVGQTGSYMDPLGSSPAGQAPGAPSGMAVALPPPTL